MDDFSVNIEGVFKALDDMKCLYKIVEPISGNNVVIRASFNSIQLAKKLFSDISRNTLTRWVRYRKFSPKRDTYHAVWKCHLSSYRKSKSSTRNTGCNALFSIRIKCISKWTKKRDEYLRLDPPLCGKITFALEHNHFLYSTANLAKLQVSDQMRNVFFSYFSMGMTVSEAKDAHESHLLSSGEKIRNKYVNPTWAQLYHLDTLFRSGKYKTWREAFQSYKDEKKDVSSFIKKETNLDYVLSTKVSSCRKSHKGLNPVRKRKRRSSSSSDATEDKSLDQIYIKEDVFSAKEEESMDERSLSSNENNGPDKLRYFIFGPKTPDKETELTHCVSHGEALTAAETLFSYMLSENDADHSDLFLIQSYIEKIKEKVSMEE